MSDLEIKAIWPSWKNVPETMCEGNLTPIRWFKKYLNENYLILYKGCINKNRYYKTKLSASVIDAILGDLKIDKVKPNGIYNLPCFPSNKKNSIIDEMSKYYLLVKL